MNIQPIVCPNCEKGVIVPLQDTSKEGGNPFVKAWCCTHCNDNVMLYQGSLTRQTVQIPRG